MRSVLRKKLSSFNFNHNSSKTWYFVGISGWYGLSPPPSVSLHHSVTSVGGLELSINFSHHTDRERVLSSARILGWELFGDSAEDREDEEKEGTASERMCTMTFSIIMPRAWLPVHCLLLPGHTELQRSTYCYYRYKLYDQEAFCSELRHPAICDAEEGEGIATVAFMTSHAVELRVSQPLLWYLREERLEVQLWVSFDKEKRMRPDKLDRLVGSAFLNLSAIATSNHMQTISGTVIFLYYIYYVYPTYSYTDPPFIYVHFLHENLKYASLNRYYRI